MDYKNYNFKITKANADKLKMLKAYDNFARAVNEQKDDIINGRYYNQYLDNIHDWHRLIDIIRWDGTREGYSYWDDISRTGGNL